jgi:choline dehydrogenase-like flavoprotein
MRTPCLNWQMTRLDRYTAQVAADTLDKELRRLKIGRLELADWLRQDDCSWPQDLVGGRHHMGTTRMATKSDEGIVDSDCKAYALDNLYIAGSSVFPTAGYVNPTLTLVALAFRLADHLKTLHARAHVASA